VSGLYDITVNTDLSYIGAAVCDGVTVCAGGYDAYAARIPGCRVFENYLLNICQNGTADITATIHFSNAIPDWVAITIAVAIALICLLAAVSVAVYGCLLIKQIEAETAVRLRDMPPSQGDGE
jgi:hypothetical protein